MDEHVTHPHEVGDVVAERHRLADGLDHVRRLALGSVDAAQVAGHRLDADGGAPEAAAQLGHLLAVRARRRRRRANRRRPRAHPPGRTGRPAPADRGSDRGSQRTARRRPRRTSPRPGPTTTTSSRPQSVRRRWTHRRSDSAAQTVQRRDSSRTARARRHRAACGEARRAPGRERPKRSGGQSRPSYAVSSAIRGWLRWILVVVGWMPALRVRSRTSLTCSSIIRVMTVPLLPARAVRPLRCR